MQLQVSNLEEQHAAATKKADVRKEQFLGTGELKHRAVNYQVEQPDL